MDCEGIDAPSTVDATGSPHDQFNGSENLNGHDVVCSLQPGSSAQNASQSQMESLSTNGSRSCELRRDIDGNGATHSSQDASDVSRRPMRLFERILAGGDGVFYRSQQRGELDLSEADKLAVLQELFAEKPAVFLERYHRFVDSEFSDLFHVNADADADGRVRMYLETIAASERDAEARRQRAQRRGRGGENSATAPSATAIRTRNLRYAELLRLRASGTYFSNEKMRERAPLLFDVMVGKYLDDSEKFHLRPTLDMKLSNGESASNFTNLLEQFDETQRISDRRNLQMDEALSGAKDFTDRFLNHVEHRITEADVSGVEDAFEMEFDSSDEEGREAERRRQSECLRRRRSRRNFAALAGEPPLMKNLRNQQNGVEKPSSSDFTNHQFSALRVSKPHAVPTSTAANVGRGATTPIKTEANNDQDETDEAYVRDDLVLEESSNHAHAFAEDADADGAEWSSGDEDESLATGISKERLRDEFVSMMEQRFLSGEDAAFFDYARLESEAWAERNAALNRLRDQDLEDAYFAEE